MKSFAQALDLKDSQEIVDTYRNFHRKVWPEVIEGLKAVGITNMKIFLKGRRLFMYLEAQDDFDVTRDFGRYMNSARAQEWDTIMRDFQMPVPGAASGEWWSRMEEVFDLNQKQDIGQ